MDKTYLLIAGDHYYPNSGTEDWIGCFETREEALAFTKKTTNRGCDDYKVRLKNGKWELVDWINIIDLKEWTK